MSEEVIAYVAGLDATLTDYEFELLVRTRVQRHMNNALMAAAGVGATISDYYQSVVFTYNTTGGKWSATLGANYENQCNASGEVLSLTMHDVVEIVRRKHNNKMSLLLPSFAPSSPPAPADSDDMPL